MIPKKFILVGMLIVALSLFFFVLPSQAKITAKSDIPVAPGCTPVQMGVLINGEVTVKDKTYWSFEPQPIITDATAAQVAQNYFGLIKTDYKIKVEIVQDGLVRGEANIIESSLWNNVDRLTSASHPYSITFKMPDNNCDGKVDDFTGKLVATISPEDQVVQQFEKNLAFRSGEVTLS